jgi:hypothetical protein
MRIYDGRIGKFLSVDPLQKEYPELTPYQFTDNSPICNVDLDGLERLYYTLSYSNNKPFPVLAKVEYSHNTIFGKQNWAPSAEVFYNDKTYVFDSRVNVSFGGEHPLTVAKLADFFSAPENFTSKEGFRSDLFLRTAISLTSEAVNRSMPFIMKGGVQNRGRYSTVTGSTNKQASAANSGNTDVAKSNAASSLTSEIPEWNGPLDYSPLKEPRKVGPGLETTPTQRQRILEYNKRLNGGVLRNDEDGSILDWPTNVPKGGKANMNQAEVDHIDERSTGGSNSNTNLRVISKRQNLDKESNRRKK